MYSTSAKFDLQKARILVVDDNPTSLEMISQIMMGFRVLKLKPCRSAEEARGFVATERFDLILIDFEMPDEDGPSLVRYIRSDSKQPNHTAPILMLNGTTSLNTISRARDAGANMVVKKPIAPAILLDRIKWIARNNRDFVGSTTYCGPDRRFRNLPLSDGTRERRADALALIADPSRAMSQDDISALFG
ncbi:response regulator [uncultured Brevundimonas sp.]|uniref:response regulator n=1 Tax=uncultured Brevundimonas sp. TaxID=213418 RepID=UPI0030EE6C85|tara:strand:+ start:13433 stop:14002 length:570 start_codon:yes stop_codon:yes gene_type:complete